MVCDDDDNNDSVVVALDMDSNSLRGTIPSEITRLSELTYLSLHGNSIDGWLLPLSSLAASELKHLSLSANNINGTPPGSEIAQLTALTHLDISFNDFSGALPSEILSSMTALRVLGISFNGFTNIQIAGESSSSSSSLTRLNLAPNQFSGRLPSEIGFLTSLQDFVLVQQLL